MTHYTPTSPEVSVLMAVHDAGGTVRRAVESLQGQTLRNFELIAVDAGSSDETARQLDALAERDMRVKVVRADDCARAEALNLALDRAQGTYGLVMDADGWADATMLEDLVRMAEDSSLELVVGGYALTVGLAGGRASQAEVSSEETVFATQHDFRASAWRLFASGQLLPSAAKLFSLAYARAHDVRFSGSCPADHAFVLGLLADVERVGVLGGTCYRLDRTIDPGPALTGQAGYRMLEDEHTALLATYRHWALDGDAASMEMLQSRYVEQLAGCIEGICGLGSPVPAADQKRLVAQMIDSDRAQLAASVARPQGSSARAMLAPIRSHNAALVSVQARLVSLLRRGAVAEMVPDAFL